MGYRNALYRKAMDLLTEEDQMEEDEARSIIMEELNRQVTLYIKSCLNYCA